MLGLTRDSPAAVTCKLVRAIFCFNGPRPAPMDDCSREGVGGLHDDWLGAALRRRAAVEKLLNDVCVHLIPL
jgi:hypothetical protein